MVFVGESKIRKYIQFESGVSEKMKVLHVYKNQ